MAWACRSPRISRLICCGGCRRRFGRSWAKALTKKGKFVFLVNEALKPVIPHETARRRKRPALRGRRQDPVGPHPGSEHWLWRRISDGGGHRSQGSAGGWRRGGSDCRRTQCAPALCTYVFTGSCRPTVTSPPTALRRHSVCRSIPIRARAFWECFGE